MEHEGRAEPFGIADMAGGADEFGELVVGESGGSNAERRVIDIATHVTAVAIGLQGSR